MATTRKNPDSELNIKRIDSKRESGGTHGFQVYFKRNRVEYTRLYSDLKYGGKENARELAREFRPILEASIPASRGGAPNFTGHARSNSGRMGISISEIDLANGTTKLIVQCSVRVARGITKNRRFNTKDRTLAEAIDAAHRWRERMLSARRKAERFVAAN